MSGDQFLKKVMICMVGDRRPHRKTSLNVVTVHFQKLSDWQKADKNGERRSMTSLVSSAVLG